MIFVVCFLYLYMRIITTAITASRAIIAMTSVFTDMESPVFGFSACAVVALSAVVVTFGKVVVKSPIIPPPVVEGVPVVLGSVVASPVVNGAVVVVMGAVVGCVAFSVVGACVGCSVLSCVLGCCVSVGLMVSDSEGFAVSVSTVSRFQFPSACPFRIRRFHRLVSVGVVPSLSALSHWFPLFLLPP